MSGFWVHETDVDVDVLSAWRKYIETVLPLNVLAFDPTCAYILAPLDRLVVVPYCVPDVKLELHAVQLLVLYTLKGAFTADPVYPDEYTGFLVDVTVAYEVFAPPTGILDVDDLDADIDLPVYDVSEFVADTDAVSVADELDLFTHVSVQDHVPVLLVMLGSDNVHVLEEPDADVVPDSEYLEFGSDVFVTVAVSYTV